MARPSTSSARRRNPTADAWPPWNLSPFSWDAFFASPGDRRCSRWLILTSLGVWGLPQMVHKFYAIRDTKARAAGDRHLDGRSPR